MSTFINPTELDLKEETVVCINRVSKATTGGRSMRFNSLVVVGDGQGHEDRAPRSERAGDRRAARRHPAASGTDRQIMDREGVEGGPGPNPEGDGQCRHGVGGGVLVAFFQRG